MWNKKRRNKKKFHRSRNNFAGTFETGETAMRRCDAQNKGVVIKTSKNIISLSFITYLYIITTHFTAPPSHYNTIHYYTWLHTIFVTLFHSPFYHHLLTIVIFMLYVTFFSFFFFCRTTHQMLLTQQYGENCATLKTTLQYSTRRERG